MIRRLWLLAAVTAWPVCAFAWGNRGAPRDDGHMDGYGHMMDSWGGGAFMWLVLFLIVGVLVYFLIRASAAGGSRLPQEETPLDILKKRYARGEITKEQFDEMKKDL